MVKKNTISSNGGPGVGVLAPAVGVAIQNNILASNAGLGIDLGVDGRTTNDALDADTGANFLQNYAVLTKMEFGSVDSAGNRIAGLTGTLQAEPLTNYRFDVYQGVEGPSPDDPQVTINNTVFQSITFTTDATGFGSFVMSVDLHAGARIVTGTITDPIGSTSELSPAFRVPDLEVKSAACGASGLEALLPLLLAALRRRRRNRS
jgi:hypothetical protein